MKDAHVEVFIEEARELLAELETSLLELKEAPTDGELVARIFRALHTIKGSGAMFGFDEIADFTHGIENTYDLVRSKKMAVTGHLIDLTLAACDAIRGMTGDAPPDPAKAQTLHEQFQELLLKQAGADPDGRGISGLKVAGAEIADQGHEVTYRIRFRPDRDIFATGTNPALLLSELGEMGPCKITAQTNDIPFLDDIDPESCYVFWDIVLTTARGENAIRDVFIFVEDRSELKISVIDLPAEAEDTSYKKLGEILVERGDANPEALQQVLGAQKRVGELLVSEGHVSQDRIVSALAEQEHVREMRARRASQDDAAATIRVPAARLDRLVDMVGELVTVQSRLSALAARAMETDLALVAEDVERLTAELRDNTMSIRMLPIGNIFLKFRRLVHNLSAELGKELRLTTEGGETELDKTVIEKLGDPLVHLVRNSIDHGIEEPAARLAAGKPQTGHIKLTAEHAGANVLISISDDGAGISPEAVRQKAIARNIISPDAFLSEKDTLGLIFAPGFSLAQSVTNVSGRGVGLDVVKKSIDSLGGAIDIENRPGAGVTITLKLPLTLAIIDGLLVRIGDAFFVIPLSAIEECVELSREDVGEAHGRNVVTVRGEMVPYIPLRERFSIDGEPPAIEQIIINRVGDHRVGLVVDQVVGEHQTVIKSLGKFYRRIREISGATILGDGTVALIIDVPQLVRIVDEEQNLLR
jgi:two-component system chemotaxis sensor kinase CheA